MGPLRSGMLEMIIVSWGPAACAPFSAPFCPPPLCAKASGAETATRQRTSSAKPACATPRWQTLTTAWITNASSGCRPGPRKEADTCASNLGSVANQTKGRAKTASLGPFPIAALPADAAGHCLGRSQSTAAAGTQQFSVQGLRIQPGPARFACRRVAGGPQ